ncbi:MAG: hypothetical protein IV086_02490 [Hyphomonadaceae bacterium]|nr:hypothetical protein [Hyphomonadaceae bacterium]
MRVKKERKFRKREGFHTTKRMWKPDAKRDRRALKAEAERRLKEAPIAGSKPVPVVDPHADIIGTRVSHRTFGEGEVIAVRAKGKWRIRFGSDLDNPKVMTIISLTLISTKQDQATNRDQRSQFDTSSDRTP